MHQVENYIYRVGMTRYSDCAGIRPQALNSATRGFTFSYEGPADEALCQQFVYREHAQAPHEAGARAEGGLTEQPRQTRRRIRSCRARFRLEHG